MLKPQVSSQTFPHPALLPPVEDCCQRLKLVQMDRITATRHARQEQDLLLDIGRQLPQVHDLRNPSAGDLPELGQGHVVTDRAGAEELLVA